MRWRGLAGGGCAQNRGARRWACRCDSDGDGLACTMRSTPVLRSYTNAGCYICIAGRICAGSAFGPWACRCGGWAHKFPMFRNALTRSNGHSRTPCGRPTYRYCNRVVFLGVVLLELQAGKEHSNSDGNFSRSANPAKVNSCGQGRFFATWQIVMNSHS